MLPYILKVLVIACNKIIGFYPKVHSLQLKFRFPQKFHLNLPYLRLFIPKIISFNICNLIIHSVKHLEFMYLIKINQNKSMKLRLLLNFSSEYLF